MTKLLRPLSALTAAALTLSGVGVAQANVSQELSSALLSSTGAATPPRSDTQEVERSFRDAYERNGWVPDTHRDEFATELLEYRTHPDNLWHPYEPQHTLHFADYAWDYWGDYGVQLVRFEHRYAERAIEYADNFTEPAGPGSTIGIDVASDTEFIYIALVF